MNARIYTWFLSFYPTEFRNEFGEEMKEVFLQDLEESRQRQGRTGAVRVWWRSLRELCSIALAAEVSRPAVAVPLIAYVLQFVYMVGAVFLARKDPLNSLPESPGQALLLVLLTSFIPAVVARIAICVGDHSVPIPLSLASE